MNGQKEDLEDAVARASLFTRDIEMINARLNSLPSNRQRGQSSSGGRKTPESSFARQLIEERRLRDELLGRDLFGEPVWNMLLDLFVASEEKEKVSVSSLCVASGVPVTTALRWINTLTARSIIHRHRDVNDGRRVWVELSAPMAGYMRRLIKLWMAEREEHGGQAA